MADATSAVIPLRRRMIDDITLRNTQAATTTIAKTQSQFDRLSLEVVPSRLRGAPCPCLGGSGYLPSPRSCICPRSRRPPRTRAALRDAGDRTVPDSRARRPCRGLPDLRCVSPIIPAAIGIAPSVRVRSRAIGSRRGRATFCRCLIFMWSSRCTPRLHP